MKPSRRLVVVLALAAIALLVVVGIGAYGLIVGPPRQPNMPPASTPDAMATSSPPAGTTSRRILATSDPEAFARSVAAALFDWDTTATAGPAAIVELVMTVTDPSGEETPGLYQDVQGYLPTAEQWRQLREYDTRQRLEIASAAIPDSWAGIAADPANAIADGVYAVTVVGTRVREGGWHGESTVKQQPVAFTLFVGCPPDGGRCHLLRLSALGQALR